MSRATIEVGSRRYRYWRGALPMCEAGSVDYDRPRGFPPRLRRCGKPATHSLLGHRWPLYLCAECAPRAADGHPGLTVVEGIYDVAPAKVRP